MGTLRHILSSSVLLAASLLTGATLHAQESSEVPELLIPVDDQATLDGLFSPLNVHNRMRAYEAKRYRIVKINFAALEKENGEITMTPFDKVRMRIKALGSKGSPSGNELREWTGELTSPHPKYAINTQTRQEFQLPIQRVTLWVQTGPHEVPLSVLRKIETQEKGGRFSASDRQGPPGAVGKMDLKTVSGNWRVFALGSRVVLSPLPDDPRFHIIYEVDEEKVPSISHGPDERKRKLEEHRERLEREREAFEKSSAQR